MVVKVSSWGSAPAPRGAHNWNKVLSTKQLSAILTSPLLPLRWTRAGDPGLGWGWLGTNEKWSISGSGVPVLLSSAPQPRYWIRDPGPGHQPRLSQWHFYWDWNGISFYFFRTSINIFFSFKFLDDLKEFRSWFIEISEQILEICL